MNRHPKASWAALAVTLLPLALPAAGPQLAVQQVQMEKGTWPRSMRGRAWVNVVGASGSPIQGLGPDIFRVYEGGNSSSSKITKVETLESLGTGASIVQISPPGSNRIFALPASSFPKLSMRREPKPR